MEDGQDGQLPTDNLYEVNDLINNDEHLEQEDLTDQEIENLGDLVMNNMGLSSNYKRSGGSNDKSNFRRKQRQKKKIDLINTLKIQIKQLKKSLDDKNLEADNTTSENNEMKLSLIKSKEELISMENVINNLNVEKSKLEAKIQLLTLDIREKEKEIKRLNYKNIELSQKLISEENMKNFNKNLEANLKQNNEGNSNFLQEIFEKEKEIFESRIKYQLEEALIKNEKLAFEFDVINKKLELMKKDKENEIANVNELSQNQMNSYEKTISNLKQEINELFRDKNDLLMNINASKCDNEFDKNDIYVKLSELETKIRDYDEENFNLKKTLQDKENECEEMKLILDNKETVIQKLTSDLENVESEFQEQLSNYQQNNEINDNNIKEKEELIQELSNEIELMKEENVKFKNGFAQMTAKINEANKLYLEKTEEFEHKIKEKDVKLKDYKKKIVTLKIKIDELYIELNNEKVIKRNNLNYAIGLNGFNSIYDYPPKYQLKMNTNIDNFGGNNMDNNSFSQISNASNAGGNMAFNQNYNPILNDMDNIFTKPNIESKAKSKNKSSFTFMNKDENDLNNKDSIKLENDETQNQIDKLNVFKETLNEVEEKLKEES